MAAVLDVDILISSFKFDGIATVQRKMYNLRFVAVDRFSFPDIFDGGGQV